MPSIVSYQKHIDSIRTVEIRLPEDATLLQRIGTELATIDGITYVSLPDGASLPANQPEEIAASIQTVTLTPALREAFPGRRVECALVWTYGATLMALPDALLDAQVV